MEATAIHPKRWTRAQYDVIVNAGVFQPDDRVELINGEILAMSPQESPHATAVGLVQDGLRQVFDPVTCHIREEKPFIIDPDSEPEPDIAVVTGTRRDYLQGHPSTALLIVEVAESSLTYDRKTKGPLYARAGIADYWIVNLVDRSLEIYRKPERRGDTWDYRLVQRLNPGDSIAPLAVPTKTILVADLLP